MVKAKIKEREIYLCGEIRKKTAQAVKRALKELDKTPDQPIDVFISSLGGNAGASLEIHHAFHNAKSVVRTIGFGRVASGGLIALQGGDERLAKPSCLMQFHQACVEFKFKSRSYNGKALMGIAHRLFRADAVELYILTSRGSIPEKIVPLFDKDAVINSKQALKLKIIDGIWKRPINMPR